MNGFPYFDPEMHRQLFQITDNVRKLRLNPSSLNWDQYCALMNELCQSLNMSLENGLEEAIRYLDRQGQSNPQIVKEATEIVQNVERFSKFLEFEKKVLQQKLPKETVNDVLTCVKAVQANSKMASAKVDADRLIKSIKALRDSACRSSSALESRLKEEKYGYGVDKFFLKVYGTTLTVGNLSFLAFTLGASVVPSSASVSLGSAMLTWEGKLKDPGQKRPKQN